MPTRKREFSPGEKSFMLNKQTLYLSILLALTTTTVVADQSEKCLGGVCYVNLDKHEPSKGFEQDQKLLQIEDPRFLENDIDKSATIVLDGETITVFPKSSYVMSEEEIKYTDAVEESLVTIEYDLQETVLEKIIKLPNSEYFCDKDSMPVIDVETGFYECV